MADQFTAGVSSVAGHPLAIWIEPWCDELEIPARSTLTLCVEAAEGESAVAPTIEINDDQLIIWASCPGTMQVFIDGIAQDTGSRTIDLPAAIFNMPVKSFVELVFGDQPATRPGGRPLLSKTGWLPWLVGRLSKLRRS